MVSVSKCSCCKTSLYPRCIRVHLHSGLQVQDARRLRPFPHQLRHLGGRHPRRGPQLFGREVCAQGPHARRRQVREQQGTEGTILELQWNSDKWLFTGWSICSDSWVVVTWILAVPSSAGSACSLCWWEISRTQLAEQLGKMVDRTKSIQPNYPKRWTTL